MATVGVKGLNDQIAIFNHVSNAGDSVN